MGMSVHLSLWMCKSRWLRLFCAALEIRNWLRSDDVFWPNFINLPEDVGSGVWQAEYIFLKSSKLRWIPNEKIKRAFPTEKIIWVAMRYYLYQVVIICLKSYQEMRKKNFFLKFACSEMETLDLSSGWHFPHTGLIHGGKCMRICVWRLTPPASLPAPIMWTQ